jgi:hypothetical protein
MLPSSQVIYERTPASNGRDFRGQVTSSQVIYERTPASNGRDFRGQVKAVLTLSPGGNTFTTLVHAPSLQEGTILGSVSGNSEGEQRIKFTFDIAFGQPDAIVGEPVLKTLEYLAFMVETIVSIFESEF